MMTNLRIAALLLATAAIAIAADVAGKWTGEMPGRQAGTVTFVFKSDGDKLTGTMTGPQGRQITLQDGKISGDQISFNIQGPNGKMLFQGTVAGEEIKMTRTREGGRSRAFTLKRAQ
ncbi:MAG TPA: hypothetical protein VFL57_11695 [Bryobacteraceae bacterium]|nr:hypothetical protein [Bryobacteraceae bacterium]